MTTRRDPPEGPAPPDLAGIDARLGPARERLRAVCVTGTNGKTTTTSMIDSIVAAAGEVPARVTTLGTWVAGERVSEEITLEAFARGAERALAAGARTIAIETTSKSLESGFAWRWPPRVAVFTNLTRDHLDYHGTPERYLAAKAQLFMALREGGTAVLNAADPSSALLAEVTAPAVRRAAYSARGVDAACASLPLVLSGVRVDAGREGTVVTLAASDLADRLGGRLVLAVVGDVHAENALAAALAADALGYPADAIRRGLESFAGVPGRFEIVSRAPLVAVDYAHTPDALARTLAMARRIAAAGDVPGRVICVFGCGGNRDTGKRPQMGRAADELADEVFLTNDNPRREDPGAVADAVQSGVERPRARWTRELDRARAIDLAVAASDPHDVVVVAGKGHERTQAIGDREVPFSDVDVARAACARLAAGRR